MEQINKIGRRKSAVARVYVKNGKGNITINGKDYKDYFPLAHMQYHVELPLMLNDVRNNYDININVKGGGYKGQAEAVKLGISRALVEINEEFKGKIKENKLLTRDARVVERKKYGKPKARKSFQFSKR